MYVGLKCMKIADPQLRVVIREPSQLKPAQAGSEDSENSSLAISIF